MEWTFVWMMFVLKVPVVAAIWLVWWAMKAEPELSGDDDGGTKVPGPESPHPPRRPTPPRRGPHGERELPSPPRVRSRAFGRSRTLDA